MNILATYMQMNLEYFIYLGLISLNERYNIRIVVTLTNLALTSLSIHCEYRIQGSSVVQCSSIALKPLKTTA